MKKLFVIPVMFLYILAVSGIMIHAHYCGEQLASWQVYNPTDGCGDDDCDDEKEHDCCQDKVIAAKVSQDQHHVDVFKLKLSSFELPIAAPSYFTIHSEPVFTEAIKHSAHLPNGPPGLWENIPLYKLHSSFTYYG